MPPSEHTTHPVVAWPFFEAARQLGLPVEAGFELLGAKGGRAVDEARFSHDVANQLLSWAVELSGRPDFGLLAAESVEPGHFEVVELASRSQRTVGEGIETLATLTGILHDGLSVALHQGDEQSVVAISLGSGVDLHPAGFDFIAATLLIAARRQIGPEAIGRTSIRFPYARPADVSHLERFFDADVRFDADALELHFATSALARPLLRSDGQVGDVLRQAAERLLPQRARREHTERVATAIGERLGRGEITLARISRALHVSERTLRRRLQEEGKSFREVLDDVRRTQALEAVRDESRSTDQVAADLGFTTAQALHRAFRRWTGDTVQAYRSSRQGRRAKP